MPIVRFVTPAKATDSHTGLDAFANELQTLGYAYQPRYANGNPNLATTAAAAVTDLPMLDPKVTPKVIVTGGSMATAAVQTAVANAIAAGGAAGAAAATIAIVQGVGGTYYDNSTSTYNNTTGFHISVKQTCIEQLHLIPAGETVNILYDSSDTTSVPVHDYLIRNMDRKTLKFLSKTDLSGDPTIIDDSTFMLIPNADFYNDRVAIVGYVQGRLGTAGNNVYAIYPEREYKDQHGPGSHQARITVHGHDVTQIYKDAADLTGRILGKEVSVGTLPQMVEGKKDP